MQVSFTSTYRVPIQQKNRLTPNKIDALKELALKKGGYAPKYRTGNVKFSVRKKFDEGIKEVLKELGFKKYEVVDIHNVKKHEMVKALEYEDRFAPLKPKA